ncbi:DsrE family protein [Halopseudomonas salegens]|uniref:DsrE/DsrF-like family protein n=1 Tax=Halopseudomonas salegens TaxID=1434072 RepID=A0A1H2HHC9_9GAMM|nr:DsrE family protein [Halopseudomonas salegens]SDU31287.1 DsrE/DsrF-like family protein [Halopseudomonas salegens]
MRQLLRPIVLSVMAAAALAGVSAANADEHQSPRQHLLIVTSASVQTQGMAMVLGNAIAGQGHQVDVLLCDRAGDLALQNAPDDRLKPNDVSPAQLLDRLLQQGANVSVCALYLPNSEYTQADLRAGIEVATPPDMAARMTEENTRVYSF